MFPGLNRSSETLPLLKKNLETNSDFLNYIYVPTPTVLETFHFSDEAYSSYHHDLPFINQIIAPPHFLFLLVTTSHLFSRSGSPIAVNSMSFSSAHGAFSRIDHRLGHKTSLNKYKGWEAYKLCPSITME